MGFEKIRDKLKFAIASTFGSFPEPLRSTPGPSKILLAELEAQQWARLRADVLRSPGGSVVEEAIAYHREKQATINTPTKEITPL